MGERSLRPVSARSPSHAPEAVGNNADAGSQGARPGTWLHCSLETRETPTNVQALCVWLHPSRANEWRPAKELSGSHCKCRHHCQVGEWMETLPNLASWKIAN